ncbi:MAG: aldo/keto reductase, partial [Armatimonadota bacterium]
PDEITAAATPKLPTRVLGRTKLRLTAMCMGGIGLEDPAVLNHALDVGFNTVHTAPGYVRGRSIAAVGEVMKTRRKGVILLLKGEPDSIDSSLKILNTTWVECIMPQTDTPEQAADPKRREDFMKAKAAGKVRFMGCAIHTRVPEILKAVAAQKYYDMAMIVYNPASGNTAEKTALDEAIAEARKVGMGIVAMKSVRGRTVEEQTESVKSLLTDARLDAVVKTFRTHQDVDRFRDVTAQMAKLPRTVSHNPVGDMLAGWACVACGQCKVCPKGIPVADILRFRMYFEEYGWHDYGREQYASLASHQLASNCDACGICVRGCGNNINIPKRLAEAHEMLTA